MKRKQSVHKLTPDIPNKLKTSIEQFKSVISEKEYKLGQMLEQIKSDTTKVLKADAFSKDQWIQYNPNKKRYEYEDGYFIGYQSIQVIIFLRESSQKEWSEKAEWRLEDKQY